jgi:hypothetical protein
MLNISAQAIMCGHARGSVIGSLPAIPASLLILAKASSCTRELELNPWPKSSRPSSSFKAQKTEPFRKHRSKPQVSAVFRSVSIKILPNAEEG